MTAARASSQSLRVDTLAREIFGRAAIAAGMNDRDEALAVCRDLAEVESAYRFALRAGEEHARTTGKAFTGRPMHARFASTCAVCRRGIREQEAIIYDAETRRAAHSECGEPAL